MTIISQSNIIDLKEVNHTNRVKELRKRNNISQQKLASLLNVHQTAISQWETGRTTPDIETANTMAKLFNVSLDYLLGREMPDQESPPRKKGVRIPVYGDTAAGVPILAIENYDSDDPDDWEEITEEMARGGDYIALRIKGNSMEPRMKTGDIVIVRLQPDVETGDVAIARVNGDSATCKKIKKTPEGLWLIPFNPEFEPMFYSPRDIAELPVTIIGKVVELRAKF